MIRGVWLSAGDVVAVVSSAFAGPSTGARTIRPSPRGVVGVIATRQSRCRDLRLEAHPGV